MEPEGFAAAAWEVAGGFLCWLVPQPGSEMKPQPRSLSPVIKIRRAEWFQHRCPARVLCFLLGKCTESTKIRLQGAQDSTSHNACISLDAFWCSRQGRAGWPRLFGLWESHGGPTRPLAGGWVTCVLFNHTP